MQQHPVFVLFDSRSDLEQLEYDGLGLSRCQNGTLQTQVAQLLMQDISGGRQQQAGEVGKKGRRRRTIGFQVALHLLDQILRLTASAILLLIKHTG